MGSWNATCQISNLPIGLGEKVRFLLLVKSPTKMDNFKSPHEEINKNDLPSESCGMEGSYSTNFWDTQFVPIKAEYNDYGSIENIEMNNLNFKFWLESVKKQLIEIPADPKNPYKDTITRDSDIDKILNSLRSGSIRFKDKYHNMALPVCQTMIREDVYQAMLKMSLKEFSYEANIAPKIIFEQGIFFFKKTVEDPPFFIKGDKNFDSHYSFMNDYDLRDCANFIYGIKGCEGSNGLTKYREWIWKKFLQGKYTIDSPEIIEFIKEISDFIYVKNVFESLRKTWHPGSGCGSQSWNVAAAAQFYKEMANIAESLENEEEYENE